MRQNFSSGMQNCQCHERFSAVFLDKIGTRIDRRNFDSDADGLAGIFAPSEPTVDAGGAVTCDHVPVFLPALRGVIFPPWFEFLSEHFVIEVDRSLGKIGRDSEMVDF